jgi:hypothetical protein
MCDNCNHCDMSHGSWWSLNFNMWCSGLVWSRLCNFAENGDRYDRCLRYDDFKSTKKTQRLESQLNHLFNVHIFRVSGESIWISELISLLNCMNCQIFILTSERDRQIHSEVTSARFWQAIEQHCFCEVVSQEQSATGVRRADGGTYSKIRNDFHLCDDEAVAGCITRTVLGFS